VFKHIRLFNGDVTVSIFKNLVWYFAKYSGLGFDFEFRKTAKMVILGSCLVVLSKTIFIVLLN